MGPAAHVEIHSFNSLSRDHGAMTAQEVMGSSYPLSTPSLGITLFRYNQHLGRRPAFNSLSRDHTPKGSGSGEISYLYFQLPLSGSRRYVYSKGVNIVSSSFNSLSRDHKNKEGELWLPLSFQLPLSGSRDCGGDRGTGCIIYLSTPSLGITHPELLLS